MPAIVLSDLKINFVFTSGNVTFGDVLQIAPKSNDKVSVGSAGGCTGDFTAQFSGVSLTNVSDADLTDSSNVNNS